MVSLFQRRVYDIAGITSKDVKVKYNDAAVEVKDFQQYVSLYSEADKVSETQEGWSYVACLSDEFRQVSFVNGIFTYKGGKHVDYLLQQILKKLTAYILKKKKVEIKPAILREQMTLFIHCTIENPSFDSQSKECLTTPSAKFGTSCVVSDKFIEKLAGLGIMEQACEMAEQKELKQLKKSDGNKSKTIRGIPKLVDANFAGTKQSKQCTLILCEGDSAKAGILSGLSPADRNILGVYPMKGKLLNVRGETLRKINENKEIIESELKAFTESRVKFSLKRLIWLVRKITVKYSAVSASKTHCNQNCLIEFQTFDLQRIEISVTARDKKTALDIGLKKVYKHVQKVFHKAQKYGRLSKNAYV
jgi:DNA topoisomerase-2